MGNCCGGGATDEHFQGEGHRLGTVGDNYRDNVPPPAATIQRGEEDAPKPLHNSNLTDAERAQIRRDRAAAAEARLKKQGGKPDKKKKKSDAPLTGPNTEPLMRWTAS